MAKLTISDAARVASVSRVTLHRYIKSGKPSLSSYCIIDTVELLRIGLVLQPDTVFQPVSGVCGRVERTPPVCRCALYSLFAPAFRSRECHTIPPCTVVRLPLTEACLRDYRTSLFMRPFTRRG